MIKFISGVLLIQLFAPSAHAAEDCNSLLSDHLTVSIQDLAKLRYDLDSQIASGKSGILVRALENSFARKKSEILAVSTLSLLAFDQVLRDEVSNLQSLEDRKNAENTANHQTQKVAVDQASIGISVVGHLNKTRRQHRVVALPDDRVLIFGGKHGDSDLVEEIEIYDTKTNQFEILGKLLEPRKVPNHIVMADGRILIWGGDGQLYLDSVEIIDPALKTVTRGDFKFRGRGPITRISDSQFLQWTPFGVARWKVVDVEKNTVSDLWAEEKTSGLIFSALKNGDLIYSQKTKFYKIDSSKNLAVEAGDTQEVREHGLAQVALPDDQVLLSGGMTKDRSIETVSSTIERYNPSTRKSEIIGNLIQARANHTMLLIPDGRVVVLGGRGKSSVRGVEIIDPATGISEEIGEMQYLEAEPPAVVLSNGDVLIVGANGTNLIERIKVGKR